jgi:hypothetical protein
MTCGRQDNGPYSGAAYVFVRSGGVWTEQQKLVPGDGTPGELFGYSAALSGDTALLGAIFDDETGEDSGAGYVFTRSGTGWTEQQKLVASDGTTEDCFGFSVALSGDRALVGALQSDNNAPYSGSAYVFDLKLSQGSSCASDMACGSGFCVDGVCCDTACGGGASKDCQACSAAAGAVSDGTCTQLTKGKKAHPGKKNCSKGH